MKQPPTLYYRFIRWIARLSFPRADTVFEVEPDEPAVFVCNHSTIIGPVMTTLHFPLPQTSWTVSNAMSEDTAVSYAYHDVLVGRSRRFKGFWRILARIVSRMLPPVLRCSDVIPVYHDRRIITTFKESVRALEEGVNLIIFGESPERYSEYVNKLQPGLVDVARLYYRKTKKPLSFYPVYAEKKNHLISVGKPIAYDPDGDHDEQRESITDYLSGNIDRLARQMKPHKPVPFLSERWYAAYGEYEKDAFGYWKMISEDPEFRK